MCRIALTNSKSLQNIAIILRKLEKSNGGDGNGIALLNHEGQLLFFRKGYEYSIKNIIRDISRYLDDYSLLLFHTRLASSGGICDELCHPFAGERFILVHNGHFTSVENISKMLNIYNLIPKYEAQQKKREYYLHSYAHTYTYTISGGRSDTQIAHFLLEYLAKHLPHFSPITFISNIAYNDKLIVFDRQAKEFIIVGHLYFQYDDTGEWWILSQPELPHRYQNFPFKTNGISIPLSTMNLSSLLTILHEHKYEPVTLSSSFWRKGNKK